MRPSPPAPSRVSLRALLMVALGSAALYLVVLVAWVNIRFLPQIVALREDTQRIVTQFEGYADNAHALDTLVDRARARLDEGELGEAARIVEAVHVLVPATLTSSGATIISDAPAEMRRDLARAIDVEMDVRDLVSEAHAHLTLGDAPRADRALERADSATLALNASLASAQQAGMEDVARRGAVLEAAGRDASRVLLIWGALGALGVLAIALLIRRRLWLPLSRLDAGLQALSEGELGATVPVGPADELGRLAHVFNQASAALRQRDREGRSERQEMTARILASTQDAVITIDLDGTVTGWNPGAKQTFGWPQSEAIGRELAEMIIPPELRGRHREGLARYRDEAEAPLFGKRVELPALHKDGSTFTSELSIVPLVEEGRRVAYAAFIRDVTEARRAEEAIRQSEELLRGVIDNTTAIITIKDLDGRYRMVNRRFCELFEVVLEDVIGRTSSHVVPEAAASVGRAHDDEVVEAGRPGQFRERVEFEDGPREFVSVRFPLRDSDGRPYGIAAISTDITQTVELEEQVRRAQRLEAVGRLAGGVAHDFNNLVTVILGQAQLALAQTEDPEVRSGLQEIERASERAAELTGQLLAFARKQIIQPRIMSVNDLVMDTMGLVHRVIEATIQVETDLDPESGLVNVDPGHFTQVLLNLVMNARDAMGAAGGAITISTRGTDQATGEEGTAFGRSGFVEIALADTGPGIPEEIHARLFEPFVTTKEGGTGLGLATCFGIVRQAGGMIEAENRPEGGAIFRVFLPRTGVTAPAGLPDDR